MSELTMAEAWEMGKEAFTEWYKKLPEEDRQRLKDLLQEFAKNPE